jgi:hypothetical protein
MRTRWLHEVGLLILPVAVKSSLFADSQRRFYDIPDSE